MAPELMEVGVSGWRERFPPSTARDRMDLIGTFWVSIGSNSHIIEPSQRVERSQMVSKGICMCCSQNRG